MTVFGVQKFRSYRSSDISLRAFLLLLAPCPSPPFGRAGVGMGEGLGGYQLIK